MGRCTNPLTMKDGLLIQIKLFLSKKKKKTFYSQFLKNTFVFWYVVYDLGIYLPINYAL